jgi:hypothetical protein
MSVRASGTAPANGPVGDAGLSVTVAADFGVNHFGTERGKYCLKQVLQGGPVGCTCLCDAKGGGIGPPDAHLTRRCRSPG